MIRFRTFSRGACFASTALAAACLDPSVREQPDASVGFIERRSTLTVDFDDPWREVPPYAYGIHTSVYDNALHDPELPAQVAQSGLALFRYPGGGYSDNYHWSNHTMSAWSDGDRGYLAAGSDFGSYVRVAERASVAMMITVNYGSNLQGDGPGEPKEAAAWVAYANGAEDDETEIGVDGAGNDWRTVGYWATLRASEPLADGSAEDFLRIAHPEPLGVRYWEVGNEVFGNGFYSLGEFELDMHAPYDGTNRIGHPDLSPTTYGREVVRFVEAMKAVDPSVKIGAVLNTAPRDYAWGPTWNEDVLRQCGDVIDFGIIHWYTGDSPGSLLGSVDDEVPQMTGDLRDLFEQYGGADHERIEIALTEVGPGLQYPGMRGRSQPAGVFALDVYLSAIEHGIMNIDWLELHNGTFLSERGDQGHAFHGIEMAHKAARPGDTLVRVESDISFIDGHAALRTDGSVSVVVFNTSARQIGVVDIELGGLEDIPMTGLKYTYAPEEGELSGVVEGPVPVTNLGEEFRVEVRPYTAITFVLGAEL